MTVFTSKTLCTSFAFLAIWLGVEPEVMAQCHPNHFLIQDQTIIQQSEQVQIAFVLTATENEFNSSKGQLGFFEKLSFGQAKEAARQISQTTKFDYAGSYAINFLQQSLSGKALEGYADCLTRDKEHPGIAAWLSNRQGEFYTIDVFWVGVTPQGTANNDAPIKVINGELIEAPKQWVRALTERVVIRKKPAADAFVTFQIGGRTGGISIVHEAPALLSRAIVSPDLLQAESYHVNSRVCGGRAVQGCIRPPDKNGFLVPGSGALGDANIGDPSHFSSEVSVDRPEQICMKITQSTGCCECRFKATGHLTAIEQYPDPDLVSAIEQATAFRDSPAPEASRTKRRKGY